MSVESKFERRMYERISSKYWDYPVEADELRISSYDAFDNPLIIVYYRKGLEVFRHNLTYDGSGRLTEKKLIRK